jgi:hypothetical protein
MALIKQHIRDKVLQWIVITITMLFMCYKCLQMVNHTSLTGLKKLLPI